MTVQPSVVSDSLISHLLTVPRRIAVPLLVFVSILLAHLLLLQFPLMPSFDHAIFFDYALHGHMATFDILPPDFRFVCNPGIFYGFVKCLGWFLHWTGGGFYAIRLFCLLASLAGLAFLFAIVYRLKLPYLYYYALVFFSATPLFLTIRPEPFLLLVVSMNVFWWMVYQKKWLAVLAGFLATAVWSVHPAIVFFLLVAPLWVWLSDGKAFLKNGAVGCWLVGAALGTVMDIQSIDLEQSLQFVHQTSHGVFLHKPYLLLYGIDLWDVLVNSLEDLMTRLPLRNSWTQYAFFGLLFGVLPWQIRRYKSLNSIERSFFLLASLLLIAFCTANSSYSVSYWLYIDPWFILNFSLVMKRLAEKKLSLDALDFAMALLVQIILLLTMLTWGNLPKASELTIPLIVMILTIAFIKASLQVERKKWVLFALLVLTLATRYFDVFRYTTWWRYGLHVHPVYFGWFMMGLALPWIVIGKKVILWAGRERWVIGYALLVVIFNFCGNVRMEYKTIQQSGLAVRAMTSFSFLGHEPKILAPLCFYFWAPHQSFRCAEAFNTGRAPFMFYVPKIIPAILAYDPTYILAPLGLVTEIERQAHFIGTPLVDITKGDLFDTPYGRFQRIRIRLRS